MGNCYDCIRLIVVILFYFCGFALSQFHHMRVHRLLAVSLHPSSGRLYCFA